VGEFHDDHEADASMEQVVSVELHNSLTPKPLLDPTTSELGKRSSGGYIEWRHGAIDEYLKVAQVVVSPLAWLEVACLGSLPHSASWHASFRILGRLYQPSHWPYAITSTDPDSVAVQETNDRLDAPPPSSPDIRAN